jgi:hypothetical protein
LLDKNSHDSTIFRALNQDLLSPLLANSVCKTIRLEAPMLDDDVPPAGGLVGDSKAF